jgi:IclR family acetate operon transcriptional repressor
LTSAALPSMQRLREATQETIHLAIAEGRHSVLLERLESPQPVRIFYAVGTRAPLHASATGKAIMSRWEEASLAAYLAEGLEAVGPRTILDMDALRDELRLTRKRGWSSTHDELGEGASAVAAPILDPSGVAVAAVSVSGPSIRFKEAERRQNADLVRAAAMEISQALYGSRPIA